MPSNESCEVKGCKSEINYVTTKRTLGLSVETEYYCSRAHILLHILESDAKLVAKNGSRTIKRLYVTLGSIVTRLLKEIDREWEKAAKPK